jgi:hypothetical protein
VEKKQDLVYRLRPFESLPAAHRNNTKAFALVLAIVRRGIRSQVTNYFLALRENNKYLRPRLGDKHPSLSRFRCEKCGLLCSATHCFVLQWLCRESEGSCIPPPAFESLPTLQTATTPVHTDVGWAVCAPGGIRTPVGRSRLVYSQMQLTTLPPTQRLHYSTHSAGVPPHGWGMLYGIYEHSAIIGGDDVV